MMNSIISKNGLVVKGSKAIAQYLNSIAEMKVSANALYDPCVLYYFNDAWHIEPRSEYLMDDLDEDHIKYWEFNTVLVAYEFIRFIESKETNNRKYGIFGFNDEAVVRIERPNRPFRKPRYNDIDINKTTLFRRPKEGESRYMPVYSF